MATNCDACTFGVEHAEHGATEQVFTFGIEYATGPLSGMTEEIDLVAPSLASAQELAEKVARAAYSPGWTRIISLPTGGSGGWVTIL